MSDAVTGYSSVWGDHYIDLLEHVAIPSWLQSGNLPAVDNFRWVCWTLESEQARIAEICERLLPGYAIELRSRDPNEEHLVSLKNMLVECLDDGSRLLLLPPDLFWGDGSIGNMVRYAEGRGFTVAAGNLRVLDTAFREALDGVTLPLTNAQVVGLTMKTLHPATELMFDDLDTNSTYMGGISLRQLGPNQWSMVHHLHSPWLVNVRPEDVGYFFSDQCLNFGDWDHRWPTILLQEERLRILGGSDLAWSAELTQAEGHYAPIIDGLRGNDRYKDRKPHNLVGGRLVMSLRAE